MGRIAICQEIKAEKGKIKKERYIQVGIYSNKKKNREKYHDS